MLKSYKGRLKKKNWIMWGKFTNGGPPLHYGDLHYIKKFQEISLTFPLHSEFFQEIRLNSITFTSFPP